MIFRTTSGLVELPGHSRTIKAPIYLTNDHKVIEFPTLWAADVAKRRSKSSETLKQYTSTLARWLNFLDDYGYGAEKWQNVDRDVIDHFVDELIKGRDEFERPGDTTIEGYLARIADFYRKASKAGYPHYWDMENEEFTRVIKDRTITTRDVETTDLKKEVTIQGGSPTRFAEEMNKFVLQQDLIKAMGLFDDYVYAAIAYIMRNTALRPKELFQLPYKGTGLNIGLQPYRSVVEEQVNDDGELVSIESLVTDDAQATPVTCDIKFEFESKGKRRSISIPLHIWTFICKIWMPERARRAELFRDDENLGNGQSPSNKCLFLSKEGRPVTYGMLIHHFNQIADHPDYVKKPFTPKMLRHSWATYFVYEALKKDNDLHNDYVYNAAHDQHLRMFMGHTDVTTTYKSYVHLVHIYARKDVMGKLIEEADKELNTVIVGLAHNTSLTSSASETCYGKGQMTAVVLIGIPAVGKSTFCRQRFNDSHVLISLDKLKTRKREKLVFDECIRNRDAFVVDNTNASAADREQFINPAREAGFKVIGYYFASKTKDALERNRLREGEARIPDKGVLGIAGRLQLPKLDEGFDELWYVKMDGNGGFVVKLWN